MDNTSTQVELGLLKFFDIQAEHYERTRHMGCHGAESDPSSLFVGKLKFYMCHRDSFYMVSTC